MVHTKANSGGFHAQTGKYGSLHSILALSKSLLLLVSPFLVKKNKETGNSKKSCQILIDQATLQKEQNSATYTRSIPLSGKLEETKNRRTRKR